jgi:predicted ester cyclase
MQHFTTFFRDGPRFEFDVDELLVEGERAAVRYRFAIFDTHGRRVERGGCAFVGFANGAIVEWREYEG